MPELKVTLRATSPPLRVTLTHRSLPAPVVLGAGEQRAAVLLLDVFRGPPGPQGEKGEQGDPPPEEGLDFTAYYTLAKG